MVSTEVFESRRAKVVIAVVAVLLLAAFQVAVQAKPAHATTVTVKILGAGKVDETTSASYIHCVSPATTPTGQLGNTCSDSRYGSLWGVTLQATPSPGYTFSQWQDGGGAGAIQCNGASSTTYNQPTCSFTTDWLGASAQTEAVFVDTQPPPAPTITSMFPSSGYTNGFESFNFGFISDATFKEFQCSIDRGSWNTCFSGQSYSLAEGTHTILVRASDYSGNISFGSVGASWVVDKTLPETTLDSTVGPVDGSTTQANDPTFAFSSSEPGDFLCNLQGPGLTSTAFTTCNASPNTQTTKSYTNLKDGNYTFSVKARDRAGNVDASPATRSWTILNKPTVITSSLIPLKGATGVSRITDVSATFSEPMAPTSITNSTTHVSRTFTLKQWNAKRKVWKAVPATVILSNSDQTATLDPYGATEGSTEKALAARTKFKATITTGATDASGNPLAKTVIWTFTTGRR